MTIAIPYQARKKGPYGDAEWQEKSLIYLLRSLEKHMDSPEIFLLGISKPASLSEKVHHIHIDRFYPPHAREIYKANEYENFWDTMHKLRWALNNLNEFLWVYDDVVMLREATHEELIQPWYLWEITGKAREKVLSARSRWGETIKYAYALLGTKGEEVVYNCEHHFPIYYSSHPHYRNGIEELMSYPIPAAVHTYLLNSHGVDRMRLAPLDQYHTNYGCLFYGLKHEYDGYLRFPSNTLQQVEKAAEGKLWMNYNDQGLHINGKSKPSGLKEYLEKNFPNKSCYER